MIGFDASLNLTFCHGEQMRMGEIQGGGESEVGVVTLTKRAWPPVGYITNSEAVKVKSQH